MSEGRCLYCGAPMRDHKCSQGHECRGPKFVSGQWVSGPCGHFQQGGSYGSARKGGSK